MSADPREYPANALRVRAEKRGPNRARALCWYMEQLDPQQTRPRRMTKTEEVQQHAKGNTVGPRVRGHQGHPARLTRAEKRARAANPTPEEQHIRARIREVYEAQGDWREDGPQAGLFRVAAEFVAEMLQREYPQLAGEEHWQAMSQWLYGVWGELVHRFDPQLAPSECMAGVPAYLLWRGLDG